MILKSKLGKNFFKEFEIIDDVDNDGLKDVAVYIDSEDDYNDFKSLVQKLQKYYMLQSNGYYKKINDNNDKE